MKSILRAVSTVTRVRQSDITGNTLMNIAVDARFLFYYISKERGSSQREIGKFVNKAHSSVSHLLTRHSSKIKELSEKYNKVLDIIGTEDEIEIHPIWDESFLHRRYEFGILR